MNNNFYSNDLYPNSNLNKTIAENQGITPNPGVGTPSSSMIAGPAHIDYADNIFVLNIGKKVSAYFSYPDSIEWRDKIFTGTIIDAGRDYLLLKDENNNSILLWAIYINYAIFEEDIKHNR